MFCKETRAVTRQHSSPEIVFAHPEHKVLRILSCPSRPFSKVMLLPCDTLGITYHPGTVKLKSSACDLDLEVNETGGGCTM